jgi:RNase adapter protein RapZ
LGTGCWHNWDVAEFVVVTGLSGAGRSQAGAVLEDIGWYVMDNIPTALITKVAELVSGPAPEAQRLALVVGRHAAQLGELQADIQRLRASGERVKVLFLDASDEVLVRRFEGTRRRHPLGKEGVVGAIADERRRLGAIKEMADIVVDTSDLNVNQLRERLSELFSDGETLDMQILVLSFGFKHGVPLDVDNVLDVRFLPNPHWVEAMRPLTGLDEPVRRYVLGQPEAKEFLDRVEHLLNFLVPAYVNEGKSYLTIAIGCTGGRHRSVVLAEEIANSLRELGYNPSVTHRDVDR